MAWIGRWAAALLCASLLGCTVAPESTSPSPPKPAATEGRAAAGPLPAWAIPSACRTPTPTAPPANPSASYALDSGGHTNVRTVDFGRMNGRPLVVSAGGEGTVRFWRVPGFKAAAKPLAGTAATYVDLGGRPGVLTTGDYGGRLWDLASRRILLRFPKDSKYALGDYGGVRALFISDGKKVRIWNPRTRALMGTLVTGGAQAMAVGLLDGRPVLVAYGGEEEPFRIWDLTTRRKVGREFFIGDEYATPDWMRIADIGGTPVLLVQTYLGILQWNLVTQEPRSVEISRNLGHESYPFASSALTRSGGRTVLATGEQNQDSNSLTKAVPSAVILWDPRTGRMLTRLDGHGGTVTALAAGELDGEPVLLSGSEDNTVRLWSLRTRKQIGPSSPSGPVDGVASAALTEVHGKPVAVTAEEDGTLRTWDATGRPISGPMRTGSSGGQGGSGFVAVTEADGTPVAVVADRPDRMTIWNVKTSTELARITLPRGTGRGDRGRAACPGTAGRPVIDRGHQALGWPPPRPHLGSRHPPAGRHPGLRLQAAVFAGGDVPVGDRRPGRRNRGRPIGKRADMGCRHQAAAVRLHGRTTAWRAGRRRLPRGGDGSVRLRARPVHHP